MGPVSVGEGGRGLQTDGAEAHTTMAVLKAPKMVNEGTFDVVFYHSKKKKKILCVTLGWAAEEKVLRNEVAAEARRGAGRGWRGRLWGCGPGAAGFHE